MDSNLWEHTGGPPIGAETLVGDNKVDVAIIGGGFTGCTAALYLAEAGANVCLLEAVTIGSGGSGRNVGLVNAGLWLEPEQVEARLGAHAGARLNEILAEGPALVFSLIEKHDIPAQLVRAGTLHCAHSRFGLNGLKRRFRQYLERGAPVELLDAEQTAVRTGSSRFFGALLDHRAGLVQPLAEVRGLANAAVTAGASVYEQSPVQTVVSNNGLWVVTTPRGVVKAEALILATNAYHKELVSDAAPRYVPVYFFQVATQPLDEGIRASILPNGEGAWDTAKVLTAFRLDNDGRLLLGGIGSLEGFGKVIHKAWVRRKLHHLFPSIADECNFEYAWCGCFAMTHDHIPKIVNAGKRAVSLYGYNGRGIAPGTVFGKSVAEYLLTGDVGHLPLEPKPRHRESLRAFKQTCYELGASAFHFSTNRIV